MILYYLVYFNIWKMFNIIIAFLDFELRSFLILLCLLYFQEFRGFSKSFYQPLISKVN